VALLEITDAEKLHQLGTIVLSDSVGVSGKLYLFSETVDHERSVIAAAVRHVESHSVSEVAVIDDTEDSTKGVYRGASVWEEELGKRQVIPIRIPLGDCHLQTLSEAFAVVKYALGAGWSDLTVSAPPFHQLRCFISMVTAIKHLNPGGLRVYNFPGAPLDWHQGCRHSQGVLTGTRLQFVVEELRRIVKYQREGTPVLLVSSDEVLEYIRWRDQA
jgi:hypothetical protein